MINIADRLHSTATEQTVAGANEIYDDAKGKKQDVINQENDEHFSDLEDESVRVVPQEFTQTEQAQARQNLNTYSKNEVNQIASAFTEQNYVSVQAVAATTAADIATLINATGEGERTDTIYRVGWFDGTAFDVTKYSEYTWNGSSYIQMAVRSTIGEVFDISVYNQSGGTPVQYETLALALGTNGANVPSGVRQGGMSVKFIQSSDNKYVRYNLLSDSFTTDITQWAVCNDGVYMENEEFAAVFTDDDGRIWLAVKKNADIVFGYGVPEQFKSYVYEQINEIKTGTAGTDIDGLNKIIAFLNDFTTSDTLKEYLGSTYGKYEDNPEFARVEVDSNGKLWLAVKNNGDVYFGYGVPEQFKSYVYEQINEIKTGTAGTDIDGLNKIIAFLNDFTTSDTLKEYLGSTYGKYEDNPEFARVEVDSNGKLWLAVKNNGDVYFGYGVPEQIKEFITNSISGITLLNLLNNDKRKYYYEQINSGTTIFTPTSIAGGSYLVVRFRTSGAHCALGFFDSNDTRISFNGLSNVVAGTEYFEVVYVPLNYAKATIIWGNAIDFEVYDFKSNDRLEYYYENGLLDDIPSTLKLGGNWIPDYLKDEMKTTIETINGLVDETAIVLPIQTDSHISSDPRFGETSYESLACLAYLCNNCYVDGIVHLGDVVRQDYYSFLLSEGMTATEANTEGRHIMQEYFMRFAKIHNLPMITNGNHDGVNLNKFYSKEWYGMVGRMLQANDKVHLEGNTPYFYVDFEKCNVRCVFMSCPDSYNDSYPIFGWTQQQLNWLANTALNVEDGTNIILFSHVSPLQASYTNNGLERLSSFKGICEAFDGHTSFSDTNVTCDFSSMTNGKILCEVCGHQHMDWVWEPGDSYNGTAVYVGEQEGPISWTYENTFAFPIICITNTYFGTNGDGETRDGQGGIHVPRVDRTSTQEAWDILVYRPDLNKVKLIRFGSGQDREVNV